MIINCGKEELERMSINCHNGQCSACVLDGICNIEEGKNFTEFIQGVDCYNPHKQVLNDGNTYG